jgi:protein HOOK3
MLISHSSQTVAALRQRLDELMEERDRLLDEKTREEVAMEEAEGELQIARTDCAYVLQKVANGQ